MTMTVAVLFLVALTGPEATPTPAPSVVPEGVWGGVGIRFEVGPDGAKIELDAAHGKAGGPLLLDSSGRFDVDGSFALERPGPTRAGEPTPGEPARFRGMLDGDTLTLTVTLNRSGTIAGPLTAKRGAPARLRKMY